MGTTAKVRRMMFTRSGSLPSLSIMKQTVKNIISSKKSMTRQEQSPKDEDKNEEIAPEQTTAVKDKIGDSSSSSRGNTVEDIKDSCERRPLMSRTGSFPSLAGNEATAMKNEEEKEELMTATTWLRSPVLPSKEYSMSLDRGNKGKGLKSPPSSNHSSKSRRRKKKHSGHSQQE